MIKVKSTTDYSRFKFIRGNRPIDKRVKKMIRAIKRKNMLADFPILTKPNGDGRNMIFDGQTRFEAAKQMKLPVFFIESAHIEIGDVPETNSVQSPWTARDYLHSWSERGNPHYAKLKAFVSEFGLPVTTSALMLSGKVNGSGGGSAGIGFVLRSGKFNVTNEDNARTAASFIMALKFYVPFAADRCLALAIAKLATVEQFDASRFLQKVKSNAARFVKCASSDQYIEQIEQFYNYRVRPAQLVPLSIEVRKAGK